MRRRACRRKSLAMSARLMFIALAMLLATAPAQARRSAEPSTGLSAIHFNQPPPDFTFVAENGEPQRLSALLGKPVVINFWTTWCHACIDEMPAFEQLQRRYGDR
ncbi:MAG: redoxin domain-containing protein, partial [Candidatus Eremiobacteraeota bacterium]|nr:redoxin domain-containing protein [Candidatus Eremiobacteraeota bacterium]